MFLARFSFTRWAYLWLDVLGMVNSDRSINIDCLLTGGKGVISDPINGSNVMIILQPLLPCEYMVPEYLRGSGFPILPESQRGGVISGNDISQ